MGRRGETEAPAEPAKGRVWSSITEGWATVGFENEFVSVTDLPRETLSKHPWSLGGGGAAELRERLESAAAERLGRLVASIGFAAISGADEVFLQSASVLARAGVSHRKVMITGEVLRDWMLTPELEIAWPHDDEGAPLPHAEVDDVLSFFWPYRSYLLDRKVFGRPILERGIQWWEVREVYRDRFRTPLSIAFAFVATHNHFILDRGGKVFNRSAPVIKLPAGSSEEDHLALLALLNSSVACFWMKQVFHPKGATSANRNHPDPERFAHEFSATGLEKFPIPEGALRDGKLRELARRLDRLATSRAHAVSSASWADSLSTATALRAALEARWREADRCRQSMVFLQEEIDWRAYELYGLTRINAAAPGNGPQMLPRGQRAFERVRGHKSFVRKDGVAISPEKAECETGSTELPEHYRELSAQRESEIRTNPLVAIIENYMYKRLWRDTEENIVESAFRAQLDASQLEEWFVNRVERAARSRETVFTTSRLAADIMGDVEAQIVVEVMAGARSYDLDGLVATILGNESVPNHPAHVYTDSGLIKRAAWEEAWALQRREGSGEKVGEIPVPPEYSQGSRGKSTDFLRNEYWQLRGKLDVPKERFIAFTEVPGRAGAETLYGWAGWTPLQRLKALLAIDEELEDAGVPLADRAGVLDSAWRLLPYVAREDGAAAVRLKAELQALVGPEGPSLAMMEEWRKRFPPPRMRAGRARRPARTEEDNDA